MCIGHMELWTNENGDPAARQISASWRSGCTAPAQNWQHCRVENNCVQIRGCCSEGGKEGAGEQLGSIVGYAGRGAVGCVGCPSE